MKLYGSECKNSVKTGADQPKLSGKVIPLVWYFALIVGASCTLLLVNTLTKRKTTTAVPTISAISHERFLKLSAEYETEQRELTNKVAEMQQEVDTYEQDKADFNNFSVVVRKYVGIKELTHSIVNEFVKRIVVHAPDKSSGKRVQKVDIVWNFIGMVDFPNKPQNKTTA